MSEKNAYILGTDQIELFRLGLQHEVWSVEAQRGWDNAGFKNGDTLLDLGCGPGFCAQELAYIAGPTGEVHGVDKSEAFISFLDRLSDLHGLGIQTHCADFNDMVLPDDHFDGMYCRWALAWVPDPAAVLEKVMKALKPGGRMVIQEYYDWGVIRTEPDFPALTKAIRTTYSTFKDGPSDIDVGRFLPGIVNDLGMRVVSNRPMHKMVTPGTKSWEWPASFFVSYFPRLVDQGRLTDEEVNQAMEEFKVLSADPLATISTPMMVEVIAEK